MKKLPIRKPNRLKNFDYSSSGAYFITICTRDKKHLLCDIVGDADLGVPQMNYTKYGEIADKYIRSIESSYENISVDHYVIMPNHIHMILVLHDLPKNPGGTPGVLSASGARLAPTGAERRPASPTDSHAKRGGTPGSASPTTVGRVIGAFKRFTNRESGKQLWQRSFYDHVIREKRDYEEIWKYIEENPIKWHTDEYY